jgi:hypothetical protein
MGKCSFFIKKFFDYTFNFIYHLEIQTVMMKTNGMDIIKQIRIFYGLIQTNLKITQ